MGNTVGSRQWELIVGSLLGDAFLERNGKHVRLIMDHSADQLPYVIWKGSQLLDYQPKTTVKDRFDRRTDRVYKHCILRTKTSPTLEGFYQLFYRDGFKRIPQQLPNIMTPQVLAVWIMDDGYKRNDCNAMRINTQSYSESEHIIIIDALKSLKIDATIHKQQEYFVTYIPSRSMDQLRQLVKEYIIPEMEYKIA